MKTPGYRREEVLDQILPVKEQCTAGFPPSRDTNVIRNISQQVQTIIPLQRAYEVFFKFFLYRLLCTEAILQSLFSSLDMHF